MIAFLCDLLLLLLLCDYQICLFCIILFIVFFSTYHSIFFILILVIILCAGDREDKFRTDPFRTDDIDVFAVGMNDLLGDTQTETGSFFVLATGKIGFVKTVKDQVETVFWNSDSCIFNGNKQLIFLFSCFDRDRRVIVGKLDGIIKQIV